MTYKIIIAECVLKRLSENARDDLLKRFRLTLSTDFIEIKYFNGYVLLPDSHPFYGKHYDEINKYISVHGGLTFSELVTEKMVVNSSDYFAGKFSDELKINDIGKWMVGFDTAHAFDELRHWTKEKVLAEAIQLRNQLIKIGNHKSFKEFLKSINKSKKD